MKRLLYLAFIAFGFIQCEPNKEHNQMAVAGISSKISDTKEWKESWSKENTVVVHTTSEPDNLHPTNGNSAPRSEILLLTQRTLLYTDFENQSMIAGLVKNNPEIQGDELTYKYVLKNGPKWDDNKPLSVEDILFTAKAYSCPLVNDPAVKTYWKNLYNIVVDLYDSNAFNVIMKNKNIQNGIWFGSFPILERSFHDPNNILKNFSLQQFNDTNFKGENYPELKAWAAEFNSDKFGRDPKFLNGLGMYKVEKWESGQFVTLIKKKNHWTENSVDYHEKSYPEKIIFKINKDDNSQQLEFKNQNFDVSTNVSMSTFLTLSGNSEFNSNYSALLSPTYNYTYICLNQRPDDANRRQLFTDKIVRRAIALSVPITNITKLIYRNYSDQCHQMITNVSPLKKEFNSDLEPLQFDLSEASKLLKDAKWEDSDNDGILDQTINGKKVSFEADLNYLNTSPDWRDMALLISEELKKIGIKVNPIPMELKLFIEKAKAHDFDMMLGSWAAASFSEDYTQLWHTSNWQNHGSNYAGFGNATSDALIDSIKTEIDINKRDSLSKVLQKIIYDDQPYVFLYTSMRRNIIHQRLANRLIFSDRPGILINPLRLLSINPVITLQNGTTP